jgi:repressor LexA
MEDLTGRQREILDYIRDTVADRGYPPSVREIGDALGLRSPSTVHSHLSSLVRSGHLRRDATKPRAIEVVASDAPRLHGSATRDVPLVGHIAAGVPMLAEEQIEEVLTLPTEFTGQGPVFLLRVRGDSMIGAGILDGDYVVVRSQNIAETGQIVAALVDGEEATIKRFARRNGAVVLIPENPSYEEMVFTDGVQILGKVVAVLRAI